MSVVKASVRGERGSATVLWISIIMICVLVGLVAFALTEFASARARWRSGRSRGDCCGKPCAGLRWLPAGGADRDSQ